MIPKFSTLKLVPSLEDRVRYMRRCDIGCPMVDTLDQRLERQRELVQRVLTKHHLTVEDLLAIPPSKIDERDEELQLWYHVLRDCEYIDNLR